MKSTVKIVLPKAEDESMDLCNVPVGCLVKVVDKSMYTGEILKIVDGGKEGKMAISMSKVRCYWTNLDAGTCNLKVVKFPKGTTATVSFTSTC